MQLNISLIVIGLIHWNAITLRQVPSNLETSWKCFFCKLPGAKRQSVKAISDTKLMKATADDIGQQCLAKHLI